MNTTDRQGLRQAFRRPTYLPVRVTPQGFDVACSPGLGLRGAFPMGCFRSAPSTRLEQACSVFGNLRWEVALRRQPEKTKPRVRLWGLNGPGATGAGVWVGERRVERGLGADSTNRRRPIGRRG